MGNECFTRSLLRVKEITDYFSRKLLQVLVDVICGSFTLGRQWKSNLRIKKIGSAQKFCLFIESPHAKSELNRTSLSGPPKRSKNDFFHPWKILLGSQMPNFGPLNKIRLSSNFTWGLFTRKQNFWALPFFEIRWEFFPTSFVPHSHWHPSIHICIWMYLYVLICRKLDPYRKSAPTWRQSLWRLIFIAKVINGGGM